MAAVLEAAKVTPLEAAVGLVAKVAVTPAGSPLAARVTEPVKPLPGATVTLLAAVAPCTTVALAGEDDSVKLGAGATVTATIAADEIVPLVPVMVTCEVPAATELLAVKVTVLDPVAGSVPNVAVTPVGSPVAARVTEPVNPLEALTVTVAPALPPAATKTAPGDEESVNEAAAASVMTKLWVLTQELALV